VPQQDNVRGERKDIYHITYGLGVPKHSAVNHDNALVL